MKIIGSIEGNELVTSLSPYGWRAIIDTGFTGELFLTEAHANQIGLVAIVTQLARLADGTEPELAFDLGVIDWFGEERLTQFCWIPGSRGEDVLIGIGLLKDPATELVVNFANSSVTVEKL